MLTGGKFRLGEVNCEFWTLSIDHLLQESCTGLNKKAGKGCPVLCYETDIFVLSSLNQ